jgi:hypothetical protein
MTVTVLAYTAGEATAFIIGAMLQLTSEAGEGYLEAHQAIE